MQQIKKITRGDLITRGWTQSFYATDASMDDTDFATSGGNVNECE